MVHTHLVIDDVALVAGLVEAAGARYACNQGAMVLEAVQALDEAEACVPAQRGQVLQGSSNNHAQGMSNFTCLGTSRFFACCWSPQQFVGRS